MNGQELLLSWCRANVSGYEPSIRIRSFSNGAADWKDGRVFLAILHRHRPSQISFRDCFKRPARENLRVAFDFASAELGVARLLEPSDLAGQDSPNEERLVAYVSLLRNALPAMPPPPHPVSPNFASLLNPFQFIYYLYKNNYKSYYKLYHELHN